MRKKFIILKKIEIYIAFERPLNIFCLAVSFASVGQNCNKKLLITNYLKEL